MDAPIPLITPVPGMPDWYQFQVNNVDGQVGLQLVDLNTVAGLKSQVTPLGTVLYLRLGQDHLVPISAGLDETIAILQAWKKTKMSFWQLLFS